MAMERGVGLLLSPLYAPGSFWARAFESKIAQLHPYAYPPSILRIVNNSGVAEHRTRSRLDHVLEFLDGFSFGIVP